MYKSPAFSYQDHNELMSLFKAIFSISHDGIYVCDHQGRTLLFNESLLEITRVPVSEYNHYSVFELIERQTIPTSAAALALQSRKKENLIIGYPHGQKAILTATPVFDKQNKIICVVSNVRDITELNRLQLELEETQELNSRFQETLNKMQEAIHSDQDLIYRSKLMANVISLADKFAVNDSPITLLGESGVGKDVLAQYIHLRSQRKGSFVRINCGAIPEHLLESELFGYEKGAFTGAIGSKLGLFELAQEGTIFLDEIGDLPYSLQVKLLNVLQEKQIRRVGGTNTKSLEVRVIAATNSDLQAMMDQKRFRTDLFYRLNVLSIHIPPLRERVEDITAFILYFLKKLEDRFEKRKNVSSEVLEALIAYDWPGNVRELKNIIERMYHLCDTKIISTELLPSYLKNAKPIFSLKNKENESFELTLTQSLQHSLKEVIEGFEKRYIEQMLKESSSLRECSDKLGVDISTLVRKKKRYGI